MRRLEEPELQDEATWRGLLGTKVSLRYLLRGDREHPFSEAIGMVASVEGGRLRVVDRRGNHIEIALEDILAAKSFSAG